MNKKIFLIHFFFAIFSVIKAQDPTYSQFNLNQLYYNPAYTGYQYGYQFSATYRNLWPNVPGNKAPGPLSTFHLWFDGILNLPLGSYIGLGAFAMQDVEGQGYLTTTSGGLSMAFHFPKIKYKTDQLARFKISVGVKTYYNSISIDWDKLVFTDQLNAYGGIVRPSAFNNNGINRRNYFDFDIGGLVVNNFMGKDKWYNEFGFSVAHILRPSISLLGSQKDEYTLPRKFVASYRSTVSISGDKVFIGPTILFENQGSPIMNVKNSDFYALNAGIDLFFKLGNKSWVIPLTVSLMNRASVIQKKINTNAIILGITHKGLLGKSNNAPVYYIGGAVDIPYMGLAMQTAGAYEITIGIIIPPKHGNGYSKCPYGAYDHEGYFNGSPFTGKR